MSEFLVSLIRAYSPTPSRKVLLCARDVADDLIAVSSPAPPRKPWEPDLSWATGIDIVVTPDSPPGTWRLIRHDHCTVTGDRISHEDCTILAESEPPEFLTGQDPGFTCPRCGAVSHHPDDIREGYCSRCRDWTGELARE